MVYYVKGTLLFKIFLSKVFSVRDLEKDFDQIVEVGRKRGAYVKIWQYLLTPVGSTLGPVALPVMFFGGMLFFGGIALIELPKELLQIPWLAHRFTTKNFGMGFEEKKLWTELRVKVGLGMIIWSAALLLSLLLRMVGTPGLETRVLPGLVLLVLPLLLSYILVYRFFFFPGYVAKSRSIDTRSAYLPGKKRQVKRLKEQKISTTPTKAIVGTFVAPMLYYVVMMVVSIPPNIPAQSHDHLLHQLGMVIMAMLGYLLGLLLSLGDDLRPLLPWVK